MTGRPAWRLAAIRRAAGRILGLTPLLAVALLLPGGNEPRAQDGGLVRAVEAVGMTVTDMDRSIAFYGGVLGFRKVSDVEAWGADVERLEGLFGLRVRVVRMQLGDEQIELTEYLTPRGRPIPVDSRSHDRWFQHVAIIVSDMDRAYAWLQDHRVEHASPAPQRLPDWNPNAGGIRAFYFKDPDGHPLEILWFPSGKGDARWHRLTDRLFLGIDHTAIVVSSTEASLACYRDTLGLRVVGTSENYGPEQERLNNVFGAHLRITTLRASAGPGVEFLEYLTPRDGRPTPADTRPNDIVHWQTVLLGEDAEAVARAVRNGNCAMLSAEVVAPAEPVLGFAKALLIRDPDGHALKMAQP
jgi:catechol 2,3-dioxygenase-like lactoylglutathione lyase family enzyme